MREDWDKPACNWARCIKHDIEFNPVYNVCSKCYAELEDKHDNIIRRINQEIDSAEKLTKNMPFSISTKSAIHGLRIALKIIKSEMRE